MRRPSSAHQTAVSRKTVSHRSSLYRNGQSIEASMYACINKERQIDIEPTPKTTTGQNKKNSGLHDASQSFL